MAEDFLPKINGSLLYLFINLLQKIIMMSHYLPLAPTISDKDTRPCNICVATGKVGFTLIELSIVLVIIGLIIGGVLVGKDLIRAAEIRAQIKQIDEFKIAVNAFKLKYNALPGDMPPSLAAQLGFFTFTGTYAGSVCSSSSYAFGNNDGAINNNNESYPFWSHLGDSKLIKGTFGGISGNLLTANTTGCPMGAGGGFATCTTVGICSPISKINKNSALGASANKLNAPSNLFLMFGNTQKINLFNLNTSANLAYQLDVKIDDGYPASGNVRDFYTSNFAGGIFGQTPCTTSGTTPAITYDLNPATAEQINCFPAFLW